MTQTEIVERFFSMERELRELSGKLIAKGMTVEEIKKATEKDIKDFSDFAYNNSDAIYNAIKENLIERLKNDAIKPIDALFIYLMVTNFTPINSLQSDHLSHSVTKTNDQVLANSAKSSKDLQEPISEDLEQASKEWLKPQLDRHYAVYGKRKMMELTHFDGYAMLDAIEFGAQWQKEKDNKELQFAEARGIVAGMDMLREHMMEGALNAYIAINTFPNTWMPELVICDSDDMKALIERLELEHEDKVKVIIVKDDGRNIGNN